MDAAAFPHLTEYLAKLPAGLGSYPDCRTKGILIRSSVKDVAPHASWATLPPALLEAIESPPLPTTWVSTVLTNAVHFVVADTYYPTPQALLDWNYSRTFKASNSPMYRTLTRMAGLRNFLRGAVKVHGLFQQGTDISIDFLGETRGRVLLEHPPYLHFGLTHLANEAVFAAALDAAGAQSSKVKMTESTARRAIFEVSWTE